MSYRRLARLSGLAGILSGALFLLGAVVVMTGSIVPGIPEIVGGVLIVFANVLIAFTLMGLYGVQVDQAGGMGLVGFVLAFMGLLLRLAGFFSPLGSVLFLIGIVILALAIVRTDAFPLWWMWLWFFGALMLMASGFLVFRVLMVLGLVCSGLARLVFGTALWHERHGANA